MKKKFCKKCKILVKGDKCPICGGNSFTETYYGLVAVIDTNKSKIAKELDITIPGEYALKVR
ncbi:MAG: DNA-directed polymerase subunit [Candidatus Woesearchaeota archaeon]|nr:DNA-directed polymerase subunit [Candidatus Woesearchaeota archaeon]